MRIEYTGRHVEVPDELRTLSERKLRKLGRVLHGVTDAKVVLSMDKHRQSVEVSIHSPHLTLTAADESGDAGGSLTTVFEKLTRQAQRHLGKLRERKRRGPSRAMALWSGVFGAGREAGGDAGPRIIRSRRFFVKPMTVDEAVLEVEDNDEGLLVFRNAATDRVNVLYRRRDGNLGLIEPEA